MSTLAEHPKIPNELAGAVKVGKELRKVETTEKNVLPTKEDVQQEKQHVEMITSIEHFDNTMLKSTETEEKLVLPTPADILAEKQHKEFTKNIEGFVPETLKHISITEKNVLPTIGDIAREKTLDLAATFDKSTLKHVEPNVKTNIEVIDA